MGDIEQEERLVLEEKVYSLLAENVELRHRVKKAERREAELAAHVERYVDFVKYVRKSVRRNGEYAPLITQEMDELLSSTPTQSLERLKAQCQAEKLYEVTDRTEPRKFPYTAGWPPANDELRAEADRLYAQAQGGAE